VSAERRLPCPYCGTEVEWRGESVLTCPSCGTAFSRQGSVGDHLMERINYEPGEVFKIFAQWALRMPETPNDFFASATISRCRLEFHPYWLYEISGVFAYTVQGGSSYVRLRPLAILPESIVPRGFAEEAGEETATAIVSVPGLRRDLESALGRLTLSPAGKVYFSYRYVQQRGGVLLNPDIPPEEADRAAERRAEEEVARRLSRRFGKQAAAKLVEKKTFERRLVHVPVYICEYVYGPRRHVFVAEAGTSRIIYAEVPKETRFRVVAGIAGAVSVAIALAVLSTIPRAPFFALTAASGLLLSGAYSIAKALGSTATVREFYAQ